MTKTFKTAAITLAATLLPLSAANATEPRSVEVSFADLNLSQEAGQKILNQRIENAVEAVCGKLTGKPTFDGVVRACQTETRFAAYNSRDLAIANYGSERFASMSRKIRLVAR